MDTPIKLNAWAAAISELLTEAKTAHTQWEASFKGHVPEHRWEDWYARYMWLRTIQIEATAAALATGTLFSDLTGPMGRSADLMGTETARLNEDAGKARSLNLTPRPDENPAYRAAMKDAGRGHLLKG